MPAYAIFDRDKLKSMRSVAGAGRHTDRLQPTPNAQPGVENRELIPTEGKSLEQLVGDRLEGVWRRKDSVLCVELFLSASPEYFRPDDDREYGAYQPERLDAWIDKNLEWLREEFGERNIVKGSLHLDEATPHIHAYFVPAVPDPKKPEREKLNCKKFFGGPSYVMAEWQTKYAEAMAPLGLKRGEPRGEKSEQIDALTMKQLYREIGKVGQIKERELALGQKESELDQKKTELEQRDRAFSNRGKKIAHSLQAKANDLNTLQAELARQKQEIDQRQQELDRQQRELWARTIASCLLDKSRKKSALPPPYRIEPGEEPGEKILCSGERVIMRVAGQAVIPGTVQEDDERAIARWHQQLGGMQVRQKSQNSSQLSIE